jgi:hypothetical protein
MRKLKVDTEVPVRTNITRDEHKTTHRGGVVHRVARRNHLTTRMFTNLIHPISIVIKSIRSSGTAHCEHLLNNVLKNSYLQPLGYPLIRSRNQSLKAAGRPG